MSIAKKNNLTRKKIVDFIDSTSIEEQIFYFYCFYRFLREQEMPSIEEDQSIYFVTTGKNHEKINNTPPLILADKITRNDFNDCLKVLQKPTKLYNDLLKIVERLDEDTKKRGILGFEVDEFTENWNEVYSFLKQEVGRNVNIEGSLSQETSDKSGNVLPGHKEKINSIKNKDFKSLELEQLAETYDFKNKYKTGDSEEKPKDSQERSTNEISPNEKPSTNESKPWLNLEPEFSACPSPILKHLDVSEALVSSHHKKQVVHFGNWRSVGASVRGKSHAHRGKYREDSFDIREYPCGMITTVCDGVGSSTYSRIASEFVSTSVNAKFVENMRQTALLSSYTGEDIAKLVQQAFLDGLSNTKACLGQLIETMKGAEGWNVEEPLLKGMKDLRCTLLTSVIYESPGNEILLVFRVGDGFVTRIQKDGESTTLSGDYSGELGGEVTCFFPDHDSIQRSIDSLRAYDLSNTSMILMGTDGIEDPFIPIAQNCLDIQKQLLEGVSDTLPYLDFQKPQASILSSSNPDYAMLKWLEFQKRAENDDRTLVILERINE